MATPLCEIAFKYGSDKTPLIHHPYTPFYYEYLKDKSIKKVLEIGIGGQKYRDKLIRDGFHAEIGASLKMWRDWLGAKVYGIDIDPDTMFKDKGIETFLCNGTRANQIKRLLKVIGSDIDMVIDDGSHYPKHQVRSAQILMPLLKKDIIYIIEDVRHYEFVMEELKEYELIMPDMPRRVRGDRLIIVKNK